MNSSKLHISAAHLLFLLREMIRIRRFEERCAVLYQQQKIRGFLHLYDGEEAIAVGVMQALLPADAVVATYREHGHALARGVDMNAVMAEMFGKASGCSGGRGGSMHLFDIKHRFYGGNAIVAGGLPIAVGLAMADKLLGQNQITACFFGEGAVAEGEFHESLNLATLWHLPVLFICENNRYAMGTPLAIEESEPHIYRKAASYGMAAQVVDGMNVVDVEAAAKVACNTIRNSGGPQFIECQTYRFKGHSMFDTQRYRSSDEVAEWRTKGPIVQLSEWLKANHLIEAAQVTEIEQAVDQEIERSVLAAESAAWESESELLRHVYTEQ